MFFLHNSKLNFETECNSILCSAASLDSNKDIVMGVRHSMFEYQFFSYLCLDVTSIIIEGTGGTEEKAVYPVTTILIACFWNKITHSAANIRNSLSIFKGWSRFIGSGFSRDLCLWFTAEFELQLKQRKLGTNFEIFLPEFKLPFSFKVDLSWKINASKKSLILYWLRVHIWQKQRCLHDMTYWDIYLQVIVLIVILAACHWQPHALRLASWFSFPFMSAVTSRWARHPWVWWSLP